MTTKKASLERVIAALEERLREIKQTYEEISEGDSQHLPTDEVELRIRDLEALCKVCNEDYISACASWSTEVRDKLPLFVNNEFNTYRRLYREIRLHLQRLLPSTSYNVEGLNLSRIDNTEVVPMTSVSRLSRIEPPTFDGKRENWLGFRHSFESVVINTSMSKTDKLYYLKQGLVGNVAGIFKNLPASDDNFERAWQELLDRYNNTRLLRQAHVMALIRIESVTHQNNSVEYERVLNEVQEHLMSLEDLGIRTEQWGELLLAIVTLKFDNALIEDWERFIAVQAIDPNYLAFKKFVWKRVETCAAHNQRAKTTNSTTHKSFPGKGIVTAHLAASVSCSLCKEEHGLYSCSRFVEASVAERYNIVRKTRVCFNCLREGHRVGECPSRKGCKSCGGRHHTLLHFKPNLKRRLDEIAPVEDREVRLDASPSKRVTSLHVPQITNVSRVLLATARIRVSSSDQLEKEFRALIDQGSEACFISEDAANKLRAVRKRVDIWVQGVGAVNSTRICTSVQLRIRGRKGDSPPVYVEAFVLKKVTNHMPAIGLNLQAFPHLAHLDYADDYDVIDSQVEVLLGVEVLSAILRPGVRRGIGNELIAQETSWGWILSGRMERLANDEKRNLSSHTFQIKSCGGLDECLQSFWQTEEVPHKNFMSSEDQRCEELFKTNTTRNTKGRYIVKLPFKNNKVELGQSRNNAFSAYLKLETRLRRDRELAGQYNQFLQEYLDLGHMSLVNKREESRLIYFLPHHPVIRKSNSSSKIRVVFNASARSTNGRALNDCMLSGPKLHNDLSDVILLWRFHKYVITADIEKMFRQILLSYPDTLYQCIFWRPSESSEINVYRLKTVTYGTAAAPYLAMRVLLQLAEDEAINYPEAVEIVKRNTYVNDILFGTDSLEECFTYRNQLIDLFKSGGFSLRKWDSNSKELLSDLSEDLLVRSSIKSFDNYSNKILGIDWCPTDDSFSFEVSPCDDPVITKRVVLSRIASIFDPLGWISPIIIKAKMFIQQLWKDRSEWDEELSNELSHWWREFCKDLSGASVLKIPRWVNTTKSGCIWELHGFADASNVAYAAVVYLRNRHNERNYTSLLISKTKVSPLKGMTVPRLELCAAVLLSKLLVHLKQVLKVEDDRCTCWSDSSIVLTWIQTCPSKLKSFVANRVWMITENLPNVTWRHVPTHSNPADIASRGSSVVELSSNKLWWAGPPWLDLESNRWPTLDIVSSEDFILEMKSQVLTAIVVPRQGYVESIAERFSSWARLLRFTASVKRLVSTFRKLPVLTLVQYIQEAKYFWVSFVQRSLFSMELSKLGQGIGLTKGKLSSLDPFIDEKGLIRAGGRLRHVHLTYSVKHPLILGSHHLTMLIIQSVHIGTLHGGIQLMLRVLRETYWILGARNLVKQCIHKCIICVRYRAASVSQKMGDLPEERVNPAPPFSRVGLDYAGPFILRAQVGRSKRTHKGWIALFVCLVTRAIHLELVTDYSTATFLAAFRRFVSRYGLPSIIFSDNGSNFQGANRELRNLIHKVRNSSPVINQFAVEGIEWKFIPPGSPHFGGIWEAGVKNVKFHLKRVINNQVLTFEEMSTLILQIAACLNSRPIAPLTDDIRDFSYLTPSHFLSNGMVMNLPAPSLLNEKENRLTRWQRIQQMRDQFWHIWHHDYLLQLQQRRMWRVESESLKEGDIVLLRQDSLPPCKWELGRVLKCHPGRDGLVRVVRVCTANSEFNRSVNKLCLLPLSHTASNELHDKERALEIGTEFFFKVLELGLVIKDATSGIVKPTHPRRVRERERDQPTTRISLRTLRSTAVSQSSEGNRTSKITLLPAVILEIK
ncbi:uncharacterized protein [Prorops nasuta]|uniref:uncharacterized protein n=1 Tax=Prorops nasuta TaxID=863751 RepID=UPI0034CE6D2C